MSPAAKSVYYFGLYLYLLGLVLLIAPNSLLKVFQLPETNEVWIRVVGVLVLCIGYYYHQNGRTGNRDMFRFTVHARIFVCLSFAGLVLLQYAGTSLAGFGLVDLLGAGWTWFALKKDKG